jgi:hypothetical protein
MIETTEDGRESMIAAENKRNRSCLLVDRWGLTICDFHTRLSQQRFESSDKLVELGLQGSIVACGKTGDEQEVSD